MGQVKVLTAREAADFGNPAGYPDLVAENKE